MDSQSSPSPSPSSSSMSIESESDSEPIDTSPNSTNSRDSEKRKRVETSTSSEEDADRGFRSIDIGTTGKQIDGQLHCVSSSSQKNSKRNTNPNQMQNDDSNDVDVDSSNEDEDPDISIVDTFDLEKGQKKQLKDVFVKLRVRSRSSKSSSMSVSRSPNISRNSSSCDNDTTREVSVSPSDSESCVSVVVNPDERVVGVFKQPSKRSRKNDSVPRRFNESWRVSANECLSVALTGEVSTENGKKPTNEEYRKIANSSIELFRQGEISPENAFCLRMLDFINEILSDYDDSDLPLVGHALLVMAKIYDCRVSNSHSSFLEIRNWILMHYSGCKKKKEKRVIVEVQGQDGEDEDDFDISAQNGTRSVAVENAHQNSNVFSFEINQEVCFAEKNIQLNHEELAARLYNLEIDKIYNKASERHTLSPEYFSLFKENEIQYKSKKVNESQNRKERLRLLEPVQVQDSDAEEFKRLFSNSNQEEDDLEYFDVQMGIDFDPNKHDVFGNLLHDNESENSENLRVDITNLATQIVELPSTELINLEDSGESNSYNKDDLIHESNSRDADFVSVNENEDHHVNSAEDLLKLKELHSGHIPIGHINTLDDIQTIFESSGTSDGLPKFCTGLELEKVKRNRKKKESVNKHFKPIKININEGYKLSVSQNAIAANVLNWDPEMVELFFDNQNQNSIDFDKMEKYFIDEDYKDLNLPFGKVGRKNWSQDQEQDNQDYDNQDQNQDFYSQDQDGLPYDNNIGLDNDEHVLYQLFTNIKPSSESGDEGNNSQASNIAQQLHSIPENENHEDIMLTEFNRDDENYNNDISVEHATGAESSFQNSMITELFPNAFPPSKLNAGFSNIHELNDIIKMILVRELSLDEIDCSPLLDTETTYEFDSLIQDVYKLVKLGGKEKARLSISTIFIAMLHFCHAYNIELSPSPLDDDGNSRHLIICHGKNYSQYDHIPGLIHKDGKFLVASSSSSSSSAE